MKRNLIITAAIAAVIGICSVGYCAEGDIVEGVLKDIKIVINGQEPETEDDAVVINDRTYLSLRTIAEGMGAEVEYDDEDG
ncbi:MAG: copper amine oxidase N-terminal domain-containing protein, partial [Clostridia bacterium]|nr:copper amine oxidase N-terminal domain-containing protein [Clostridia bacterium]